MPHSLVVSANAFAGLCFGQPMDAHDEAEPMHATALNPDLLAARDGDREALERVLSHSRRDLRRYAEHHCVINDIEDAVQESLLSASNHITRLREVEAFNSWLFRKIGRA